MNEENNSIFMFFLDFYSHSKCFIDLDLLVVFLQLDCF